MPQTPTITSTPRLERDAIRGDLLGAQAQLSGGVLPTHVPVSPQPIAPNAAPPQLSGAVPAMPVSGQPLSPPLVAPGQMPPGAGVGGPLPQALPMQPVPNDPCTLLKTRLAAVVQLMTPFGQELGTALASIDPSGVLRRHGVRPTMLQDLLEDPETLNDLARFIEEDLLAGRSGANPDLVTLREVANKIRALDQDPAFKSNLSVLDHLQQAAEVLEDQGRAMGCLQDPPIGQTMPAQMTLPQEA